jgi:hypothetical protein
MIYYLKCSYEGTRAGEDTHGTFAFLIETDSKDTAVHKMIEAVKASRKKDKAFLPASAQVYVDHMIEIADPLDAGLVFDLVEEKRDENEVRLSYVRETPEGYKSTVHRVNSDDEGNIDPVFSFGRNKKN